MLNRSLLREANQVELGDVSNLDLFKTGENDTYLYFKDKDTQMLFMYRFDTAAILYDANSGDMKPVPEDKYSTVADAITKAMLEKKIGIGPDFSLTKVDRDLLHPGLDRYTSGNFEYFYDVTDGDMYFSDTIVSPPIIAPVDKLAVPKVLEAIKAADEQADAAAAPAAPEPVAPAKRRRAPQEIVKQIQTALGMTSVDGVWGKDTDAAWSAWLTNNATIISLSDNKTINDLKANWAENSKHITVVKGISLSTPIKGTPEGMIEVLNLINDDKENDDREIAAAWSANIATESRWLRLAGLLKG